MNGGISQQARVMESAVKDMRAHKLPRSHYFRAFRSNRQVDCGNAETLDEARDNALIAEVFAHKDILLVHEVHDGKGKGVLHAYTIRQKAAVWRRNPVSGLSERFEPLYADHLFSVPVDAFEPTREFDALLDPASGRDPTLVEG